MSFMSGCSGAVGRPSLLPITFPSMLMGTGANVTINVTSGVYSFGLHRVYRAATTLVHSPSRSVGSALPTPSFANNYRVVCSRGIVGRICRANEKDVGLHTGCICSGSTGYVSVLSVPTAAAYRIVVRGMVSLMGRNGIGRVSSVHSRANVSKLGVAVSLGHNVSTSGLVAGLCHFAALRSSCTYGFGILVTNIPEILNMGTLLRR